MNIKGFKAKDGTVYQYDYGALANKPQEEEAPSQGSDGGYYTPVVTQPEKNKVQFDFNPSKEDMPAVEPVQVELPAGQDSGGNVDLSGYLKLPTNEDGTPNYGTVGYYAVSDGSGGITWVEAGNSGGGDTPVVPGSHGIVWDLVNVTSSNNITSVSDGASLIAVLTPAEGYTLGDVTVTMGGEALTGVWNAETATLTIASVTGDVIISCAGVENVEVTEDLKSNAMYSESWPTLSPTFTLNEDGETWTYSFDATSLPWKAAGADGGSYNVIYIGKELTGGVLSIDFDTSLISLLKARIYFTDTPLELSTTEKKTYTLDKILIPIAYSGTSGEIAISSFDTDDSNGSGFPPLGLVGPATIPIPEGYYPVVIFRGDATFAAAMTGNAVRTKYIYDNIAVTVTSGGTATESAVSTAELVDADYAMDYGVAVTALVTDESASTKVDIDESYAAVIEEAKNAWISEANGDINKIPLIIHTDQHSNMKTPELFDFISEIVDWYDVGKVINLGDTVNSYGGDLLSDSGLESYIEATASVPFSKRIEIFGNHDTWGDNEDGTGRFTPQNYLHKYFRNIYARRFDNHGNFVTYDDNYNVKYVVVSGFAYDSEKGGYSHYIIPSATIDRIIAELAKADGYDVILLSHVPLSGVNFKSLNDLWSGRKAKTSGSVTDEYGIAHAFDFTGCDGELLCGLHGHNHNDGHTQIGELVDVWFDAYYIQPRAIHFVLVDRANMELNIWKVDNSPRCENYQIALDIGTATYSITNNLTNVTNNSCMIAAIENRAYTATLTADSGYTLDSVTVTMGGTDVTADVYADGVVTIAAVTGDVVITASATAMETTTE